MIQAFELNFYVFFCHTSFDAVREDADVDLQKVDTDNSWKVV